MKLVKKIMMGVAALAATLALVSCGAGDDDPNNMITGKNSSYSIDYQNDTGSASRGYKDTAMKHAGAIVKISIDDAASSDPARNSGGIMGVIFGLEGNGEDKSAKDFFVCGVRKDNKYYISKFSGVTDILAENFGAKNESTGYAGNGATEDIIVDFEEVTLESADGMKYVYFYVYCNEDGEYEYKLLKAIPTEKVKNLKDNEFLTLEFAESDILASGTIGTDSTGYTSQQQRKLAVYANVYTDGVLVGNWDIIGTYKEAEVIE